jgi:CubicO group peptidase (beta-lactamase class C family)
MELPVPRRFGASRLPRIPAALLAAGFAAACAAASDSSGAPWPTEGWEQSSPEAEGLDGGPFVELDREVREGTYGYVNRLVVVRRGRLVVSERYENDYREISRGHSGILGCGYDTCTDGQALHDYNYFHPDFHPYHGGRDVHALQSVTKSVGSTLIGVAIHRGDVPGVEAPLLPFLEGYELSGVDERLHRATLDDLLTMRSGIEWHEDRPLDETNTTLQLEASEDWIQFTLDQPMDAAPGEKWAYNSGGSHLMSAIIKEAAGSYIDA